MATRARSKTPPFILNCLPSPKPEKNWTLETAAAAGITSAATPRSAAAAAANIDLREGWWAIGDQGNTGSCVGWGTADAVLRWHFVKGARSGPFLVGAPLRFASPIRCSPPGPGPAAGQSFVGAKRLDQKALCKLSDTSPAPVWHRGGRLACPARTALAGSSAAHSTAVPPRSGLCRADLGQARSRHAGIGAAQQPAERNHR
jgi:hypothetical protein